MKLIAAQAMSYLPAIIMSKWHISSFKEANVINHVIWSHSRVCKWTELSYTVSHRTQNHHILQVTVFILSAKEPICAVDSVLNSAENVQKIDNKSIY